MTRPPFLDSEALAARVPDGARLALAPDYYSGLPMTVIRRLVARSAQNLRLVGIPTMGFPADLLIGAGCVASVECAAVSLGEHGPAPRFAAAVKSGTIEIKDATCPAIHAGFQAAEKGVPFMPIRGIIGSDLLRVRSDWQVIDNPFASGDPIVVVPAIRPDVMLLHAPLADRNGNVWIGVRRELMCAAHAAAATLVTYEELYDGDLMRDEARAAGTIPALYISALAEARNGAWPVGLYGRYPRDDAHLALYAELARTEEGFRRYLREYVLQPVAAE